MPNCAQGQTVVKSKVYSWRRTAGVALASVAAWGLCHAGESPLAVVWHQPQGDQVLKTFSRAELRALKASTFREKAPTSAGPSEWKGPLLGSILDAAMQSLNSEAKSQIDLVVLKGAGGEQAWIPRAFVVRYPVLLAAEGKSAGGTMMSVVPVSSKPKIRTEELPHGTYWVKDVQTVELTNYREKFGRFYLKRRTDPAAMRGEKLFIQNCMACHAPSSAQLTWSGWEVSALAQSLKKHPAKTGFIEIQGKSEKALSTYWSAFRTEQSEKR